MGLCAPSHHRDEERHLESGPVLGSGPPNHGPEDRLREMGDARRGPSQTVDTVAGLGGAAAGTAISMLAGPFAGSMSGELVAQALRRVGAEIEKRFIAPRQERRISEAAKAAASSMHARFDAGDPLRNDAFFDASPGNSSSPAEELLEGVLLTAADEWEQQKVPYIGRIFAGLSFDDSISPADASFLLRMADRLTYQQLVLLAFWQAAQDRERPFDRDVQSAAIRVTEGKSRPTEMILAEMNDLDAAGLIGVRNSDGDITRVTSTMGGLGGFQPSLTGTDLTQLRLTEIGATLYRLMELNRIPDDDLSMIARALHGEPSVS